MDEVLAVAALLLSVAGLVALAAAVALARDWRAGLGMALELWVAAALLPLARPGEWAPLAVAATVVVVRHLVDAGLRAGWGYRSITKRASTSAPSGVDAGSGAGSPPGSATP